MEHGPKRTPMPGIRLFGGTCCGCHSVEWPTRRLLARRGLSRKCVEKKVVLCYVHFSDQRNGSFTYFWSQSLQIEKKGQLAYDDLARRSLPMFWLL